MLDIIIVLFLIVSFIKGAKRGVLKELVLVVGTIIIYFIAFKLKDSLGMLLCKWLPFFKFGGLYSLNVLFYQLVAFVVIMTILYSIFRIVLKVTGVFQKIVDLSIIFTIPSKLLGGLIGLLEGYIVVFTILVILSVPFSNSYLLDDSKLYGPIVTKTPILSNNTNYVTDITDDLYKLSKNNKVKDIDSLNKYILNVFKKRGIINNSDMNSVLNRGELLDFYDD